MPGHGLGIVSDVEGLTTRPTPILMLVAAGSPVAAFFICPKGIDVNPW
tara:strand:+ start:798 stop:941 length:144 start_codon:yes stop_codon:yes gene_type:complete